MRAKLLKKLEGFTIIEVLIVLAIAGLIMLIVFLAVPALQRNSRNTQLRNDAGVVAGYINEYASNNNGALPLAVCTIAANTDGIVYLSADATCSSTDPQGGRIRAGILVVSNNTGTPETSTQELTVALTRKCSGNSPDLVNTNARALSVSYLIETGGGTQAQCLES